VSGQIGNPGTYRHAKRAQALYALAWTFRTAPALTTYQEQHCPKSSVVEVEQIVPFLNTIAQRAFRSQGNFNSRMGTQRQKKHLDCWAAVYGIAAVITWFRSGSR
jgi:hypothetical protein